MDYTFISKSNQINNKYNGGTDHSVSRRAVEVENALTGKQSWNIRCITLHLIEGFVL